MNKVRVIFVDDDPAILEGLRNRLRPMRKAWHMTFSITAKEALNEINNQSYDVIVTDMRMPETHQGSSCWHTPIAVFWSSPGCDHHPR